MLWKTKYGSLKTEYFAFVLLATKTCISSCVLDRGRLVIKAVASIKCVRMFHREQGGDR